MRNVFLLAYAAASVLSAFSATFEIGEKDFLLDGKPFVVRGGEEVFGFRYTPRQGKNIGRIKDWKFFAR